MAKALPKRINTEALVRVFREQGAEDPEAAVAALLEASKNGERAKPAIVARLKPEDYSVALAALEGNSALGTRRSMVSLRHAALRYALEQQEEFAGWLEAHTVAIEHGVEPIEPVEEEVEGEPPPEEDPDEIEE